MNLKLKIFKLNSHLEKLAPIEIMATDFTILNGIVCGEPVYEKGRKVSAGYYINEAQKEVAILKTFTDRIDESGFLVGLDMKLEWFDVKGNPVLLKLIYIPLSTTEAAELIRGRRKRQINYLQETGVRMGVSQYINILFNYYSAYLKGNVTLNLLNNYIENGTKDFENAVKAETNTQISQILAATLPNGVTVKDSILNLIS